MTHPTKNQAAQAIAAAHHSGQGYCLRCGTPLNYSRSGLPNSAMYNTLTDSVTCARCSRHTSIKNTDEDPKHLVTVTDSSPSFTA